MNRFMIFLIIFGVFGKTGFTQGRWDPIWKLDGFVSARAETLVPGDNNWTTSWQAYQGLVRGYLSDNSTIEPYAQVRGMATWKDRDATIAADLDITPQIGLNFSYVNHEMCEKIKVGPAVAWGFRPSSRGVAKRAKATPMVEGLVWCLWGQGENSSLLGKDHRKYPGQSETRIGNLSPFERTDIILSTRFEQGVKIAEMGRVNIIPQFRIDLTLDSKGVPAYNRYNTFTEVKISFSWESGVLEIYGGGGCGGQLRGVTGGIKSCGPTVGAYFRNFHDLSQQRR